MLTERLEVRLPIEADRARFVALFQDPEFMVFSAGVEDPASAQERFDGMLADARAVPFAKQPVIERTSGTIIGYSGAASFVYDGAQRFEYGYRLVPEARGRGYATEAGLAVLSLAEGSFHGELLAMIDPTNTPSQHVIAKLGFSFWKQAKVDADQWLANLYRRSFA